MPNAFKHRKQLTIFDYQNHRNGSEKVKLISASPNNFAVSLQRS